MNNLKLSSSSLANNTPIAFTGLCDGSGTFIPTTEQTFTQEVLNDFIFLPIGKIPIKEISKIDVKSEVFVYEVIETPGGTGASVKNLENKQVTGKKLALSGIICLDITYTGTDAMATQDNFKGKLPFTSYIVVPKETALTQKFDISCCVSKVNIISIDSSNIINASAIFSLSAKKTTNPKPSTIDCSCSSSDPLTIVGITPSSTLKKAIINSDKLWNEVSFSRNVVLPTNLPNAKNVTSISSTIKVVSQKVIKTPKSVAGASNYYGQSLTGYKLIVEAILKQRITYVANNQEGTSHSLMINLPVSCYIVIHQPIDANPKFKITAYIEDLHSCCINSITLFSGALLFFKAQLLTSADCIPIKKNSSCCTCSKDFPFDYNVDGLCDLKKFTPFIDRSSWTEVSIYRRFYTSESSPVLSIQNVSASLNVLSRLEYNEVVTPKKYTSPSIEGFTLNGALCLIHGHLFTNVTYNSSNAKGSVITIEAPISFSAFIELIEEPRDSQHVAITACIENIFANVLDDTGIGISAQIFLKADVLDNN